MSLKMTRGRRPKEGEFHGLVLVSCSLLHHGWPAKCVELADVENALEEMLFSGGSLNLKLPGAEVGQEASCKP